MASKNIHIVDYGFGNIYSLSKALEHVGARVTIVSEPEKLKEADALILPGVGAFGDGIEELRKRGFEKTLLAEVEKGKPLLGICLGMQFLFDESEEFGRHKGLGIVSGTVKKMVLKDETCKIPHIGWNKLLLPKDREDWQGTILNSLSEGDQVYFVHSYVGLPDDQKYVIANTSYCDTILTAAVAKGNVFGTQFHPEKSGEVGLTILKKFLETI